MKRKSIYCAAAIAAVLALGAMTGCGSQPASQASTSSGSASAASSASASASEAASSSEAAPESASASEAAEKSQDEIFAELKESLASVPAYKSVTITEKSLAWVNNNEEIVEENPDEIAASSEAASDASESSEAAESDAVAESDASSASDEAAPSTNTEAAEADVSGDIAESTTVYKFDESGDKPKTSAAFELADIKMQYYTDGDDVVCVTDGPAYSGTIEQFDLMYKTQASAYLNDTIGDLNALVDCATSVTQDEINGVIGYELTLDPEKYIATDEMLKLAADSGDPVQQAYVTVGFDKDGNIVWMTKTNVFALTTSSVLLDLEDFDSTVVDPMPEATKTYEEMEADIKAKMGAIDEELDLTEMQEGEAGSAEAAEVEAE